MIVLDRPLLSVKFLGHLLGIAPDRLKALAHSVDTLYHPFSLQKKNGKARQIDNPSDWLKEVQRRIKRRILDTIVWPAFVCGGVAKRSTRDHAKSHVRQDQVVVIDLKDFFPSVASARVATLWHRHFGASLEVGWLLTRLTTWRGHLPQGAPSSSALANLAVLDATCQIDEACRAAGCRFSIYVDDLTISGDGAAELIPTVCRILSTEGFVVNRGKVDVMMASERQVVGGLVVNRGISNGREKLDSLRRELATAVAQPQDEKAIARLSGKIAQATWAAPRQAAWLQAQLRRALRRRDSPSTQ